MGLSLFHAIRLARPLAQYNALPALLALPLPGSVKLLLGTTRVLARRRPNLPDDANERLVLALQSMGPTVIKLGQVLSTRPDVIGEQLAQKLTQLQDRLEPFPFAEAKRIIEQEFSTFLDILYQSFDEQPVAAASIAQVHKAVTADGRAVAVKVVRPDVARKFARDVALFETMANSLERARPQLQRLKLREVVQTLRTTIAAEMDLRLEAAAASEMADNFRNDHEAVIPTVDWARTGHNVLTMEWMDGIRIDRIEELVNAGHNPPQLLERAAVCFFKQVYRDGFFHADLHPGNVLVQADGRLVLLDFGIVGRLDISTRYYLAEMLRGFLERDYQTVADIHFQAGYVPASQSRGLFMQACRAIGEPIVGRPLHEISLARLLGQLFQVTEQFNMPTQPQLLLLQKSMLVSEGIGRMLDSSVNMWEMAKPLIVDWSREQQHPRQQLHHLRRTVVQGVRNLPALLHKAETALDAVRLLAEQQKDRSSSWYWVRDALKEALLLVLLGGVVYGMWHYW